MRVKSETIEDAHKYRLIFYRNEIIIALRLWLFNIYLHHTKDKSTLSKWLKPSIEICFQFLVTFDEDNFIIIYDFLIIEQIN
jgi:hypothetical protein